MNYQDLNPANDDEIEFAKFIVSQERFSHADLDRLGLNNRYKENFLSRLRNRGLLRDLPRENNKAVYSVYSADEILERDKNARQTPEGRMWNAMRSHKVFSPDDIFITLAGGGDPIDVSKVKSYCQGLFRAEYLIVVEKAHAGKNPARYQLVNNSGPLAPSVRRLRCIVDGNTGVVAYVEGARQ